jgi:protein-S-isoprenylcysteine O-methyltransferase Ste14
MHLNNTLRAAIFIGWLVFWIFWITQAAQAKASVTRRRRPIALILFVAGFIVSRIVGPGTLADRVVGLEIAGTACYVGGLAFAIWARAHLGANWGMPMSERVEPELVTSGPYRFVRHPIYTGILLASLGTGIATSYYWLWVTIGLAGYFVYATTVEERNMITAFPDQYPAYKARSKRLIPFVF